MPTDFITLKAPIAQSPIAGIGWLHLALFLAVAANGGDRYQRCRCHWTPIADSLPATAPPSAGKTPLAPIAPKRTRRHGTGKQRHCRRASPDRKYNRRRHRTHRSNWSDRYPSKTHPLQWHGIGKQSRRNYRTPATAPAATPPPDPTALPSKSTATAGRHSMGKQNACQHDRSYY